jgi:hypothetical protein
MTHTTVRQGASYAQRPRARVLTLAGILANLAGAEELGGLIFTLMESFQRRPVPPVIVAAILGCELLSIPGPGV